MPNELQQALAKRRSRGEDVFESSVAQSSADAVAHALASQSRNPDLDEPPWLEGAVFVDLNADSSVSADTVGESCDGLPPWFNAAVESGVVFYDPEGQEVVVPSSKVGAFKAALETVIEFEPEPCTGPLPSVAPATDTAAATTGSGVGSADSDTGGQGVDAGAGTASESSGVAASANEAAEARRLELKANLQKRYFALLRSGLEPNDAAARAILEVSRPAAATVDPPPAAAEEQCSAGYCTGATMPGAAGAPICRPPVRASDISGDTASDSRQSTRPSTEITVSA